MRKGISNDVKSIYPQGSVAENSKNINCYKSRCRSTLRVAFRPLSMQGITQSRTFNSNPRCKHCIVEPSSRAPRDRQVDSDEAVKRIASDREVGLMLRYSRLW